MLLSDPSISQLSFLLLSHFQLLISSFLFPAWRAPRACPFWADNSKLFSTINDDSTPTLDRRVGGVGGRKRTAAGTWGCVGKTPPLLETRSPGPSRGWARRSGGREKYQRYCEGTTSEISSNSPLGAFSALLFFVFWGAFLLGRHQVCLPCFFSRHRTCRVFCAVLFFPLFSFSGGTLVCEYTRNEPGLAD